MSDADDVITDWDSPALDGDETEMTDIDVNAALTHLADRDILVSDETRSAIDVVVENFVRDRARLDWLEEHANDAIRRVGGMYPKWNIAPTGEGDDPSDDSFDGETIREAIDAALVGFIQP